MQAPVLRRPFRAPPSVGLAVLAVVAPQLVILVVGTFAATAPSAADQRPEPGGQGGAAVDASGSPAPGRSARTPAFGTPVASPGAAAPTPAPEVAAASERPVSTRPPQPVPTVAPRAVAVATPTPRPVAITDAPTAGGSSGGSSAGRSAGGSSSGGSSGGSSSGGSSNTGAAPALNPGGRPPACDYLDVLTPHAGYGDWSRTLLDTIYRLPSGYAPGDLVDTSAAGLNGGYAVRGFVVGDLREMVAAARAAGAPLEVVSGYRSFAKQQGTFQHWVDVGGYGDALRASARAGHSEHQLGTTLDLTSEGGSAPWEYGDWGATPAGAWVAENSWRYGFVVSYPGGSFSRTCYSYEPWHVRYVGRERAAWVARSGLTLREALWSLQ